MIVAGRGGLIYTIEDYMRGLCDHVHYYFMIWSSGSCGMTPPASKSGGFRFLNLGVSYHDIPRPDSIIK